MAGDPPLATGARALERLWEGSGPLVDPPPAVKPYPPGSWGPTEIGGLIAPHSWRLPFARPCREHPNPPVPDPAEQVCAGPPALLVGADHAVFALVIKRFRFVGRDGRAEVHHVE